MVDPTVDPHDAVRRSIERLYAVFGSYPLRPEFPPCKCRRPDPHEPRIRSLPVRDLSEDDLGHYSHEAVFWKGDDEDFRYFLPRMLELLPNNKLQDASIVLAKIRHGDWRSWPAEEQKAIEDYMMAVWLEILSDYQHPTHVEDWLFAVGDTVDDVSPCLAAWLDCDFPSADRWLIKMVTKTVASLARKMKLSYDLWDLRWAQMDQVIRWMLSDVVADRLQRAADKYSSEPFAYDARLAADKVEALRNGPFKTIRTVREMAESDFEQALVLARKIKYPWYRCQELSYLARCTEDLQAKRVLIHEAVDAVVTGEIRMFPEACKWPFDVLIESRLAAELGQELERVLQAIDANPEPLYRQDALVTVASHLLAAPRECLTPVLRALREAALQGKKWKKTEYNLKMVSRWVKTIDYQWAHALAMMIEDERLRVRALRGIGAAA